ncbi:hypothetical protein GLYMA_13G104450v4 [Glycine max]|nr:hypothetical protein GLYMA_13G104450v4 [Glycine max]KAH1100777.1 hypothetical protein GYH30_035760 [Glycine max]
MTTRFFFLFLQPLLLIKYGNQHVTYSPFFIFIYYVYKDEHRKKI